MSSLWGWGAAAASGASLPGACALPSTPCPGRRLPRSCAASAPHSPASRLQPPAECPPHCLRPTQQSPPEFLPPGNLASPHPNVPYSQARLLRPPPLTDVLPCPCVSPCSSLPHLLGAFSSPVGVSAWAVLGEGQTSWQAGTFRRCYVSGCGFGVYGPCKLLSAGFLPPGPPGPMSPLPVSPGPVSAGAG